MAATQLGMKYENTQRHNAATGFNDFMLPRVHNFVAATGKIFDYPHAICAFNADGVTVDTGFTGNITATVASGTCTLGGTVTRAAVAGVADFGDLTPATGTGPLSITFSGGGLTPLTTSVMTVVTPQYDAYALARHGLLIEKPRLTVDTTMPTVYAQEYTINPGAAVSATNVQTFQAAINKFVSDNFATHTRFKVTPGTYLAFLGLKKKTATTGFCVFEPSTGIPGAAGQRITRADFAAGGVKILANGNTLGADVAMYCPDKGAHHYRFNGIEFQVATTNPATYMDAVVRIYTSSYAGDGAIDTIDDNPHHIGFDRCWLHGGDNVELNKALALHGRDLFFIDGIAEDAHVKSGAATHGNGSGDEQAIIMYDTPGPVLVHNNELVGAGETMMLGGGSGAHWGVQPRDITITRNWIRKPMAWARVYKAKNNFELKCGERLYCEGNIKDGSWNTDPNIYYPDGAQNGTGNVWAVNTGGASANYHVLQDVIYRYNFERNMTAWLTLSARNNLTPFLAKRFAVYDNLAVNIDDPSTEVDVSGGAIHRMMLLANGLTDTLIEHNTVLRSPSAAANVKGLYATGPANPTTYVQNNILSCEGGLFGDGGLFGAAMTASYFPDDATFPKNVLIHRLDGNPKPSGCLDAANNAAVGFTNLTQLAAFDTLAPDAVCAALALAPATTYKGVATDARDPGPDMEAVRAAIGGVGLPGGGIPTARLRRRRAFL